MVVSTCTPSPFLSPPFWFDFVTTNSGECCCHLECWLDLVQVLCRWSQLLWVQDSNGHVCSSYLFLLLACFSACQGSFNFLIGPDILECSRKYFIPVLFIANPLTLRLIQELVFMFYLTLQRIFKKPMWLGWRDGSVHRGDCSLSDTPPTPPPTPHHTEREHQLLQVVTWPPQKCFLSLSLFPPPLKCNLKSLWL